MAEETNAVLNDTDTRETITTYNDYVTFEMLDQQGNVGRTYRLSIGTGYNQWTYTKAEVEELLAPLFLLPRAGTFENGNTFFLSPDGLSLVGIGKVNKYRVSKQRTAVV